RRRVSVRATCPRATLGNTVTLRRLRGAHSVGRDHKGKGNMMRFLTLDGKGSRRRMLGVAAGGLAGAALAACSGSASGGTDTTQSKGPVSIDILTRSGVASPTGHSQWYNSAAKTTFTPQTNITVNLIDADPDVTTKLTV